MIKNGFHLPGKRKATRRRRRRRNGRFSRPENVSLNDPFQRTVRSETENLIR